MGKERRRKKRVFREINLQMFPTKAAFKNIPGARLMKTLSFLRINWFAAFFPDRPKHPPGWGQFIINRCILTTGI
jgi:hypothetical protein